MTFVAAAIFLGTVGVVALLAIAVILRDFWWPSADANAHLSAGAKVHLELLRQIREQQREINELVNELRASR